MSEGLCHVCRYVRPLTLLREDESTRTLLHTDPSCSLTGGLMVCDPEQVTCGSPEQAVGRLVRGYVRPL